MANIYLSNSTDLKVIGFRTAVDSEYIDDAVMTAQLIDECPDSSDGEEVLESITLDYQSGTDGDYYGNFSGDVELTVGKTYLIRVTTSNYTNVRYEIEVVAGNRRV